MIKESDRNIGIRSPLLTRCQAEAGKVAVDAAAMAVVEDAVAVEAMAIEAMDPPIPKACAVHLV